MLLIIALYGTPRSSQYRLGTKMVPLKGPDFPTAQTTLGYGSSENAVSSFKIRGGSENAKLQKFTETFTLSQAASEDELVKNKSAGEVLGYWFQRDTGYLNLGIRILTKEKNTVHDIPIAKVTGNRENPTTEVLIEEIENNVWLIKGNKENYLLQIFYDPLDGQKYLELEAITTSDPTTLKPFLKQSA